MKIILFLHIIAVIVFVGNIMTAAFWKVKADLSKDRKQIYAAAKNVMVADYVFTLPGILLLLGTGIGLGSQGSYLLTEFNWLTLSLILFAITGVIWLTILIPLQKKLIRLSEEEYVRSNDLDDYRKVSKVWAVYGIVSTVIPLVILYLMVVKPL